MKHHGRFLIADGIVFFVTLVRKINQRGENEARRMAKRERAMIRRIGAIPQLLVSDDSDRV